MNVKDFLKEWKPSQLKNLSKEDRAYLLYDYLGTISEFYIKRAHKAQTEVNELFDRMENKKFAKALQTLLKMKKFVEPVIATIIADFLEKRHASISPELLQTYRELISKILKKRVKDVVKATNSKGAGAEPLFEELLVIVSEPTAVSNPRFVGIYVNKMANKLYALTKGDFMLPDTETVSKMFQELFGKEMMNDVAVALLLERQDRMKTLNDDQKETWNGLTVFALEQLESNKKKELAEVIKYYNKRRANDHSKGRDSTRRVDLTALSAEDFPRLNKVIDKLHKEELTEK